MIARLATTVLVAAHARAGGAGGAKSAAATRMLDHRGRVRLERRWTLDELRGDGVDGVCEPYRGAATRLDVAAGFSAVVLAVLGAVPPSCKPCVKNCYYLGTSSENHKMTTAMVHQSSSCTNATNDRKLRMLFLAIAVPIHGQV